MHLYFFLRGINNYVELAKIHLQSQFFKRRMINEETKKEEIVLVQGALRPTIWGAYEYVFPKEALPEVLSYLKIADGNIGARKTLKNKIGLSLMRNFFNCKPIPKKDMEKAKKIKCSFLIQESERGLADFCVPGVAIHPIGIKHDEHGVLDGYYMELL